MFKSVTKSSVQIGDPEQMPESLRQAFRASTSGKPGPSHIEIAGAAGEEIELAEINKNLIIEKEFTKLPAYRITPEKKLIEKVAYTLEKAKFPIIIAGGGLRASGASKELVEFQHEIDSLKLVEIEKSKPKIFPFNPNFIIEIGSGATEIIT